jgi:hypothetical protein
MKLRLLDNSIRMRLTRTEVRRIENDDIVRGSVQFPAEAHFDYVLESSPACVAATARLENNVLTVCLPETAAHEWAKSDSVSIRAEQPLDSGPPLQVLIEKDFACLTPRAEEDESDLFPHPDEGAGVC